MLDPVDRLLLQEATAALAGVSADQVVVLDDVTASLATAASAETGPGPLRVHCDSLADEQRLAAEAMAADASIALEPELGAPLLSAARVVLLRLPKSLAALDEQAEAVARYADPDVRLLAGGRVKHMTRGMNEVLARHFTSVSASLGQQKSRVLRAAGPRETRALTYPRREHHEDLDLEVCAHGAVFAGSGVDLGTRRLLTFLAQMDQASAEVADLGCGSGVLATLAARQLPLARVHAVDDSSAACRSTRATVVSNGVGDRVGVRRTHLLSGVSDASLDLVLCNPPFHRGTARDSDMAFAMFADAHRALRAGGELWTVYNSHLPYLNALRRLVGPTRIMEQTPHYVVARSSAAHP